MVRLECDPAYYLDTLNCITGPVAVITPPAHISPCYRAFLQLSYRTRRHPGDVMCLSCPFLLQTNVKSPHGLRAVVDAPRTNHSYTTSQAWWCPRCPSE